MCTPGFLVASLVGLALLSGCAQSRRVEIPGDASIVDGASRDAATRDAAVRDAAIDPALVGIVPSSCGQPDQGLVPVDCTARGDTASQCVFGNHCFCSEGFRCEVRGDFEPECDPGVICVPR
jgi:hypothetical protein